MSPIPSSASSNLTSIPIMELSTMILVLLIPVDTSLFKILTKLFLHELVYLAKTRGHLSALA